MKKITKLVAVSAAAMTFGITGVSALNNTNVVNADNINTDNATLSSKIQEVKNSTNEDGKGYTEFWLETQDINSVANEVENNVNPETVKDHLQNKTADQLSGVYNENNKNGDWNNYRDAYKQDSMTMTGETANEFQGLYQDGTKVLEEIDNYIGGKQQSNLLHKTIIIQTQTSKIQIMLTPKTQITMQIHKATHQTKKLM